MKKPLAFLMVVILFFSLISVTAPASAQGSDETTTHEMPDEIFIVGDPDASYIVQSIADGSLDMSWENYPMSFYLGLGEGILSSLNLHQTSTSYFDLTFNTYHDPDKDAPIVTVGDQVYFNPFAMRKVRLAMNYLINRTYIVQSIEDESGAPMFGAIRPSHPSSGYFEYVYSSLGLSAGGNVTRAMELFNEAMEEAISQVSAYGHTLERGDDGLWYFDGEPVTIKFVIRTEDWRHDIGLYVADLMEEYLGFSVDRQLMNRDEAGPIVFSHPPSDYEWNVYTGGWAGTGDPSLWIDDYAAWFYAAWYGYVPGAVEPKHQNTLTVGEALEYIGGGDIALGLERINATYYTTPESLGSILDWTEEELTYFLVYFSISRSSASGSPHLNPDVIPEETLRITDEDQYWDLQKISMLLGILESPRIFITENHGFNPSSRERVSAIVSSPNTGIANRWSVMTATTPDGMLRIGSTIPSGSLYWGSFNPVGGMTSVYNTRIWSLIRDYGIAMNFRGLMSPYRCTWELERGPFTVPETAVVYNQTLGWISAHSGETASVRVLVQCDLGTWHNGVPGDINDIKNYVAFLYTWAFQDYPDDPYYEGELAWREDGANLHNVLGFEWTGDGYVVYGTYEHPLADDVTASKYIFYPQLPWELYWTMGELVARDGEYGISTDYSFTTQSDKVALDMLLPEHMNDLRSVMETVLAGGALGSFPGIDWSSASERLSADIDFYDEHGHMAISNGPYYLDEYDRDSQVMHLLKNPSYPFTAADVASWTEGEVVYGGGGGEIFRRLPPVIVNVSVEPQRQLVGENVMISWRISNTSNITRVWLTIQRPDGTTFQRDFDPSAGSYMYSYTVDSTGLYYVIISAEDESGKVNRMSLWFYGISGEEEPAAKPLLMNFTLVPDPDMGIEDVAAGILDILLQAYPSFKYDELSGDEVANLSLYRTVVSYDELTFNTYHDPDKDAPIVTVGDQVYFNPFAMRKVRLAMNYLISRDHIVNDIRSGSGEPMFGCVRPGHPANGYFEPVYDVLGLTEEGNVYYALDIFRDAMEEAASQVSAYGHTLERGDDGLWYFDGEPVTIKFIIRIEDERREIGDYVADLIEDYLGFRVERLYWDRRTAGSVVFARPPSDYEWNVYTGGWVSMGIPPVWVDDYTAFFYAAWYGYVPGAVEPKHQNTLTVREALEYLGGGSASNGLTLLGTHYYETPESLGPILDWSEEELSYFLKNFWINRDAALATPHLNADLVPEETMWITDEDQYWDLQKISMLLGILESPRVFLMENVNFYPANRERVESIMAESSTGIANRWSLITAETPDSTLKVGLTGRFLSPANPIGGMRDFYSRSVLNLVVDYGASVNFNGHVAPYRCSWSLEKGSFSVPSDAVIYTQTDGWVPFHAGEEASVRVSVQCDLGTWHNGVPGDINDIKNYVAFLYTWTTQDGFDDRYYDPALADVLRGNLGIDLGNVLGFEWTGDGYVVYGTYEHPLADDVTASKYIFYPQLPWELYWTMGELVANHPTYGIYKAYSFTDGSMEWLDLLNSSHVQDLNTVIEAILSNESIASSFPGIDWSSALDRLNADLSFSELHGHLFISNGPYYIDGYSEEPFNVVLRFFDPYPVTRGEFMTFLTGYHEETDTSPPSIVNVRVTPESQEVGNVTTISWVASDDSGLANVTLEIDGPTGEPLKVEFDPSLGVYAYNYTIPAVGTYTAKITVGDVYGNVREVSIEFYGKRTVVETVTVNSSTENVTVSGEDVELSMDVNESVEGQQEVVVNVTVTTNEEEIEGENVTELAVATAENETVAPVKYVAVEVETNESVVERYTLRVSYTDEEIRGIDEGTLSIYYWNGSSWIQVTDYIGERIPNGPFIYDTGVNTEENYVWAVVDHFSVYAIGGIPVPEVRVLSPADGEVFVVNKSANVTVVWSGDDELAIDHYEVRLDGGEWINVGLSTEYTFEELSVGEYTVYVKAVNIAGRESTVEASFKIVRKKMSPNLHSRTNLVMMYWILYRYQEMKFEKLYNRSSQAGVSNETLQRAAEYASIAEEYYKEAMKYGELPQTMMICQIRPLRLAYINIRRAVEILEEALEEIHK
ncbi:ABC transporter substrate-binding protein [Thermococcus radiotolerans]|nr:ABC transporter substrate-binding protein [Thermococcus radiotolerans]